jgi:hypothetical protein
MGNEFQKKEVLTESIPNARKVEPAIKLYDYCSEISQSRLSISYCQCSSEDAGWSGCFTLSSVGWKTRIKFGYQ